MFDLIATPLQAVIALATGYLLGSIPFGLLLTRAAGFGDVRSIGSGNIGATNVLRTGNKKLAALTLLLDALKGTAAVVLARYIAPDAALFAGLGAFLGHLYPAWLGFKGGKGVATYLGVLIALWWPGALIFAVFWLGTAFLTRISSLSALVAAVAVPASIFIAGHPKIGTLLVFMSLIVFIKHRPNIGRILSGTETRIGSKG
ncbi:glycerol-3-phosphate 1-O-acyltransferase PlsY [Limoniibacter endophyticus]|uniref:Glycerol-3-phosphate acyltransferase n=1 Tax=Limoniibacter endophyticus TaxID=1565040 RepID=A0A8J3DG39_9HYPH|nr:glycerol-3-phosphate 1-O-acyltransferase PlsY [Limoniibacter endophyticus]GHC62300.1 glycerol-3-phosphate acyltransferase [Limoniibacter endophyticus]